MKAYKNRIVYAQHMRLKMKDVYLKIEEKNTKNHWKEYFFQSRRKEHESMKEKKRKKKENKHR